MFVEAVDLKGIKHTMLDDTDSFKMSYDDNDSIHVVLKKDGEFTIFSEEPFEDEKLGQIDRYEVSYEDGKKIVITQDSMDVWEFLEV